MREWFPPRQDASSDAKTGSDSSGRLLSVATYVLYAVFACVVFHKALTCQNETCRLLAECRRVRLEIAHGRQQNETGKKLLAALQADPFYVERVLRERYGYRAYGEEERLKPQQAPQVNPADSRRTEFARTRTSRRTRRN